MKKIIIALSMAMGALAGTAAAETPTMNTETAVPVKPNFVEKTEQVVQEKKRDLVRIKVDYIVDETGRSYVVFIESNRPDIHDRVIRMVENMPAQKGTEHRKNNIVIEYEL